MSWRFPWTKRHRGTYRSAKQRAQDEQAAVDLMMLQAWKDDLREHPEYLRQVTRQKFGLSEPIGEDYYGSEDSGLETYRKWRKMVKEEAEEERPSSGKLEALLNSEAGKAVAEGLVKMMMPQIQKMQQEQPQIRRVEPEQIAQPEPEQLAEAQPEPEPTKEEKMVVFIEQLMAMSPEEAAVNIYQHKDNPKDIRYMIYSYVTENDFDSIVDYIPMITTAPSNEFLVPLAGKLDRKWMALVYDELNTLRKKEETLGQD